MHRGKSNNSTYRSKRCLGAKAATRAKFSYGIWSCSPVMAIVVYDQKGNIGENSADVLYKKNAI